MPARTLFRPVGLSELELVLEAGGRAFPPRLPEQPIFYPVLEQEYAEQIARDWNAREQAAGYAGFVTAFDVDAAYVDEFEVHTVGGAVHRELWVPADELAEFNAHLCSPIRPILAFYGAGYRGPDTKPTLLKGLAAREQLRALARTLPHYLFDLGGEVAVHRTVVAANFAFWSALSASEQELTDEAKRATLQAIVRAWEAMVREVPPCHRGVIIPTTSLRRGSPGSQAPSG